MGIYQDMRQVLAGIRERVPGKSRRERRAIARRKLIPDDCVCPECEEIVLESNRWIIREGVSICKSCFQKSLLV